MIKLKYSDYIIGFAWITAIFLLIVQFTFGIKEFFNVYGMMGILLPSIFLYCFGLVGFYLFKRKKKIYIKK